MNKLIIFFTILNFALFVYLPSNQIGGVFAQTVAPSNYLEVFNNLKTSYNSLSTKDLSNISVESRPTVEDINSLEREISSLQGECLSVSSNSSLNSKNRAITKATSPFRNIDKLSKYLNDLELLTSSYLRECFERNEFKQASENLYSFINTDSGTLKLQELASKKIACNIETAMNLANAQKDQMQNYAVFRKYVDQSVNVSNDKTTRYNDLEENRKKLNQENTVLAEKTEKLIERLDFLNTKIRSERLEADLLGKEIAFDYETLTQSTSIYESKPNLSSESNSTKIGLSIDKNHTWYVFEDKKSLFEFFKLLKSSNTEVRLIQQKASTILEKNQSIKNLIAEKISNKATLTSISNKILENSSLLDEYDREQSELSGQLDSYKNVAQDKRVEDKELRKNLATLTQAVEACTNTLLSEFNLLKKEGEKLPEDVILEMDREYETQFSKKALSDLKNAESLSSTNLTKFIEVLSNYKNFIPKYVNCEQSTKLTIKNNSNIIKTSPAIGTNGISVEIKENEILSKQIEDLLQKYDTSSIVNTSGQIGIQNYLNFINSTFSEKEPLLLPDGLEAIITYNTWNQEIKIIEDSYKVYECTNKNWTEIDSYKKLDLELGKCTSSKTQTINIKNAETQIDLNKEIPSQISQLIENTQIKLFGSCKQ